MQRRAILGGTFNPPHWGHLAVATAALEQVALQQVIWVPAGQPPHRTIDSLPKLHHRLEMIRLAIAPYPAFSLTTVECDRDSPSYAINTLIDLQGQYPPSQWYWIIGLDAFQTLPRWYRRLELIPRCTWLVAPRAVSATQAKLTQTGQARQNSQANPLELASFGLENSPESSDSTVVSSQAVAYPPVFENSSHFYLSGNHNPTSKTHSFALTCRALCQHVVQQLASQQIEIQWQLLDMPSLDVSSSLIRQQWGDRRSISTLVPAAVQAYIQQHQLYAPSP